MGKRGPCFHCGIECKFLFNTPLWRNGPPEKPVLCNACGSRYRLRGTLANYIPKHSLQSFPTKKQQNVSNIINAVPIGRSNNNILDMEDNVSTSVPHSVSSGDDDDSDISCTDHHEHVVKLDDVEDDQLSGGIAQPEFWNSQVSSKKRSELVIHPLSPIERLQKDLYSMLKCSNISNSNIEDILIYNVNEKYLPLNEIGLGLILLKSPIFDAKADNQKSTTTCSSMIVNKFPCFNSGDHQIGPSSLQAGTTSLK